MSAIYDPLEKTISVYNQIAESYASRWFDSHALDIFLERFMESVSPGSILDAGCGCGREIKTLRSRNWDCVGIDLSDQMLSQARARVDDATFRLMDLRYPDFPDSLFSGILCIAVINHFYEEDLFAALGSLVAYSQAEASWLSRLKWERERKPTNTGAL